MHGRTSSRPRLGCFAATPVQVTVDFLRRFPRASPDLLSTLRQATICNEALAASAIGCSLHKARASGWASRGGKREEGEREGESGEAT